MDPNRWPVRQWDRERHLASFRSRDYSILTNFLRDIRPTEPAPFEVRFETPPGRQAQVDFAHFRTVFTDAPGTERLLWLFSLVLGHSRMLWVRFVLHQDLPTLLRCQAAAFEVSTTT